ncbi:MAG: hypothetical protein ACI9NQ_002182 [Paracoccaceae bacterium]|jgi:hypothetical protein
MTILADLPFNPNVVIVLAMVVIGAIKAFLERGQKNNGTEPPAREEEDYVDPYDLYEAELKRQRADMELSLPVKTQAPPPIPVARTPGPATRAAPVRPTLTAAERKALENLKQRSPSKQQSFTSTKLRVQKHLSSPTAAREALLLAEILGPPKSLQAERRV